MRETNNTNNNEKTTLVAKLMATENINVRFDHVDTAAFDLENRELILPIYEGLSQNVYNMMVAHEVSHALHTPWGDWHDFVGGDSRKQQYANILEDARIERLIKRRYPGVVREMKAGYADIHERDFFGIADKDLSTLSLIDRLNLHFKSYGHLSVPFSSTELHWIEKVDSTRTFEDVMALVEKLYESESQSPEQEPESGDGEESKEETAGNSNESDQENSTDSNGPEGDDSNDEGDGETDGDSDGDDADGEENGDGDDFLKKAMDSLANGEEQGEEKNALAESNGEEDGEETSEAQNENASKGFSDDADTSSPVEPAESETENALNENLRQARSDQTFRAATAVVRIPEIDANWKSLVISAEDFLATERHLFVNRGARFRDRDSENYRSLTTEESLAKAYSELTKTNNKVINHMVKEFEMKKSAEAHKRSMTSKTGAIDMDRLHEYQTSDDIFLRNTVVPEGKNHGVVMYVDFSGSMGGPRVANSMAQIFNMVSFCSKVGIPYTVYAFTNGGWNFQNGVSDGTQEYHRTNEKMIAATSALGSHDYGNPNRLYGYGGQSTRVVQIIHNELRKKDWLLAMGLIAGVAKNNDYFAYNFFSRYSGGTPLDTCLYLAPYIINDFTRRYSIDKTIFLLYTDGGAGDRYFVTDRSGRKNNADHALTFVDPLTKTTWNSADIRGRYGTDALQNVLTDRISRATNAKVMGFDIMPKNRGFQVLDSVRKMTNGKIGPDAYTPEAKMFAKNFKKEGFYHVTNAFGFDSFTFVSDSASVENVELENELKGDTKDVSTRQLQGAFVRSNRKTNDSRFLVKKLMDVIA